MQYHRWNDRGREEQKRKESMTTPRFQTLVTSLRTPEEREQDLSENKTFPGNAEFDLLSGYPVKK